MFPNLVFGGEQEHGYCASTENVACIVADGFALAESIESIKEVRNGVAQ